MAKQKVLLCPDVPNWAFDNIADHIIANHSDTYAFERYYMGGCSGYPHVFLNQVFRIMDEFDIVHFFWREDVQHMLNPDAMYRAATEFGVDLEHLFERLSRTVITSSVYDHLFLDPMHFAWRERAFSYMDGYSVSSALLNDIYKGIEMFPDPMAVLPDGVDLARFKPDRLDRFERTDRPLRIGWVGNANWGAETGRDPKGLKTILNPAISALQDEGCAVEAHFADASVARRTREEMIGYYAEIDVLVCSSEIEGTPNPVLEAMASGVPVVSTDVGIVRDALGTQQSAFILKERSVDAMRAALKRLHTDRTLLAGLSQENLNSIQSWDWRKMTEGWPAFWDRAQQRQIEGNRVPLKRHMLRERYAAWYAENIKYRSAWGGEAMGAQLKRKLHTKAVNWIYQTPERAAWINRLRGRR